MLDAVKTYIDAVNGSDISFYQFYTNYVSKIQDMDIDNEVLAYVRSQTTEYTAAIAKLERARKRQRKKALNQYTVC